jgi:hypothetical protein
VREERGRVALDDEVKPDVDFAAALFPTPAAAAPAERVPAQSVH